MRAASRLILEACRAQKQRTDLHIDTALFRQLIEDTRRLNPRDGVWITYSWADPSGAAWVWAHGSRIYPKGYAYIIPKEAK